MQTQKVPQMVKQLLACSISWTQTEGSCRCQFFTQQTARTWPLLVLISLGQVASLFMCTTHTQYKNTSEINVCFHRIAALSWYLFQRRQSPTLSNSAVREQLYNSPSSPQGDPQIHYQKCNQTTFGAVAGVKFPSKAGGLALHGGWVSHTLFLCADLQIARMRRFSSPFI